MKSSITKESLMEHIDGSLTPEDISEIYGITKRSVVRVALRYGLSFPRYVQSQETKDRRSASLCHFHSKNPMFGSKQIDAAIRTIRGKSLEDIVGQDRAKILNCRRSERMMGHKSSSETKRKMSERRTGKTFGDKWCQNISISRKKGFKTGQIRLSPRAGFGIGGYRQDIGHYVRSTYEHLFARWLKGHGVVYGYETRSFSIIVNGVATQLTPDFIVDGIWYEIKNPFNVKDEVFNSKLDAFKKQYPNEMIRIIVGDRRWSKCKSEEDIDKVMESQKDLVEIRGVFKPFVVRMAGEETKPWEAE